MDLIFHDELISSQESHPLLVNPPYNLTLTIAELTTPKGPKERQAKAKKDRDHDESEDIPRPHNAFIIFRTDYAAKIKAVQQKISIRLISQMASNQWKHEPELVKVFFKLLADMYQQRHKNLYPDYKYAPKINRSSSSSSSDNNGKKLSNKARREEIKSKKEKKGKIITWYIHDNMRKSSDTKAFRHADISIRNDDDIGSSEEHSSQRLPVAPATFINYTASSTNPLVLHSTTTTTSRSNTFNSFDDSIITSLSPSMYNYGATDDGFFLPENNVVLPNMFDEWGNFGDEPIFL